MHTPLVTVLIPTFNRRKFLEKAVQSVLQEKRIDIRLHIFDNASQDDTESYVRNIMIQDPRLLYTRNENNIGALENYRKAFDSVKTQYFIPLADDDSLLPDFIFSAAAIMESDSELGAAIFITEQRDTSGTLEATYPSLGNVKFGRREPAEHIRDWMKFGHYAWSSTLWRTSAMHAAGRLNCAANLASDVDFQAQVFCRYPVQLVNAVGAIYASHQHQTSRTFNILSIPGWANLFQRLDRTVADLSLLEADEYLNHRRIMVDRFKGIWRIPSNTPLPETQILYLAALAGFRLGDWDFALTLLPSEQNPTNREPPGRGDLARILILPDWQKSQGGSKNLGTKEYKNRISSLLSFIKNIDAKICYFDNIINKQSHIVRHISQYESEIERLENLIQIKEKHIVELKNSRWRKIGRIFGLAKAASFE